MPTELRFDDLDLREQPAISFPKGDYADIPPTNSAAGCSLDDCTM